MPVERTESMKWFRIWHGTTTDPKFRLIAKRAKRPLVEVVAYWVHLLEFGSERPLDSRGSIRGLNLETVAIALEAEVKAIERIHARMAELGLLDGDRIVNWHKRNPKRERDDPSAERVRRHRERKHSAAAADTNIDVTPRNASVTPSDAQRREDQTRRDENRSEEESARPLSAQSGELELGDKAQRVDLGSPQEFLDLWNEMATQTGLPL